MLNEKPYYIIKVMDDNQGEGWIARNITRKKITNNINDACFIDITSDIFNKYIEDFVVLETIPYLFPDKKYVLKFRYPKTENEYLQERDPFSHQRIMKEVPIEEATIYKNLSTISNACYSMYLDPVEI